MADIEKIAARPSAYLAETGDPQLIGGLVFFILGISALIPRLLPESPSAKYYWIGALYAGACCAWAMFFWGKKLKERLVYPRGGYVEPRSRAWSRSLGYASFVLIAAIAGVAMVWRERLPDLESRLLWPAFAAVFTLLCLVSGWIQKSRLMVLAGLYMAGLAAFLWWVPLGNYERGLCLEAAVGAPVAVFGAIRLRRFLKANPRPVETVHG